MRVTIEETGALAVVRLTGRAAAAGLPALENACLSLAQKGCGGVLLDLSRVPAWTKGGLAALVDMVTRWPTTRGRGAPALGICGLERGPRADLAAAGLDQVLPLYDSLAAARAVAPFRALPLAGLSTVMLCAKETAAGPIGAASAPALLDVLGRPVLGRLFDHLAEYGLTQALLASDPTHAATIRRACGTGAGQGLARLSGLHAFHSTTQDTAAATLVALQQDHGAFDAETLVITGPCVTDMDLAALVDHHRASGGEATLAMAAGAEGGIAPSGIAVLSPAAIAALEARGTLLPHVTDLGAALADAGVACATWTTPARAIAPSNPAAYMALMTALLEDRMPGQTPIGHRAERGLWVAPGAKLARRVEIDGACWVGPAAQIDAGATLKGATVVGAGARVAKGSLLRDGMLWAGAQMQPGALVDGMIAAADWAVSHRVHPGQPIQDAVLDRISGAPTLPAAPRVPRALAAAPMAQSA